MHCVDINVEEDSMRLLVFQNMGIEKNINNRKISAKTKALRIAPLSFTAQLNTMNWFKLYSHFLFWNSNRHCI